MIGNFSLHLKSSVTAEVNRKACSTPFLSLNRLGSGASLVVHFESAEHYETFVRGLIAELEDHTRAKNLVEQSN